MYVKEEACHCHLLKTLFTIISSFVLSVLLCNIFIVIFALIVSYKELSELTVVVVQIVFKAK